MKDLREVIKEIVDNTKIKSAESEVEIDVTPDNFYHGVIAKQKHGKKAVDKVLNKFKSKDPMKKEDVFEQLMPKQLNALMETLVRNKNRFDTLYNALASDGFVPVNENSDYKTKRAVLSEMLKDGQFTKQMLETLVESNHLQVGRMEEVNNGIKPEDVDNEESINAEFNDNEDEIDDEIDDTPVNAFGVQSDEPVPTVDDFMKPGAGSVSGEIKEPTKIGSIDPEMLGGTKYDKLAQAKQDYDASSKDMQANLTAMKELVSLASTPEFPTGYQSINKFLVDMRHKYGEWDQFNKDIADEVNALVQQQKSVQPKAINAKKIMTPPVYQPANMETSDMYEAKQSEMALRAGPKGKIFESRLKKLEPYKKVALLEFLENDPKMMDDQDYADMAMLTGICEGEIVAMRVQYETEVLNEMTYPVFGGQDVRGENEKNEKKALTRDLKQTKDSQETTEEKVYDFKVKKFSLEDTKNAEEKSGSVDQNRGMHTQVDVLNQTSNDNQKERYEDEANGVFGKRDPKEVKNDANVGDGKVYGSEGTTKVGKDLLKKGADQPAYYEMSSNEGEKPIADKDRPIAAKDAAHQPINVHDKGKKVNEDVYRMKGLFDYNPNAYANTKTKKSVDVIFEQQLNEMKVLSESVDTSGRPSKEQLAEMKDINFGDKKAKTDGENCFDADGNKLEECGTVKEVRNNQLKAGLEIDPKQLKAGTDEGNLDEGKKKIKQDDPSVSKDEPKKDELGKKEVKDGKDSFTLNFGKRKIEEYDISNLDEGKETGKMCTECGHKVYETKDGAKKCFCKGAPKEKKEDIVEAEIARQNKLAGIKTTVNEGSEFLGIKVIGRKGYGYWDVTQYPQGGDFKRFNGSETGVIVKGFVKNDVDEVRIKLDNGRTIVANQNYVERAEGGSLVPPDTDLDESKRQQLRHSKGTQLRTGTDEDVIDEAKNKQLAHSKGTQLSTGTEEVLDEAKNKQLAHSKGLQLKAGTKIEEEK